MITTVIIVSLALYWLMLESDWLTVRLSGFWCEIGACCQWHLPDEAVTDSQRQELIRSWNMDKLIKARFETGAQAPLCGWGYAWQYRNVQPEIKVEVEAWGVRNFVTMKTSDAKLLRELSTAMMKPNREQRKELTAQRKAAKC